MIREVLAIVYLLKNALAAHCNLTNIIVIVIIATPYLTDIGQSKWVN